MRLLLSIFFSLITPFDSKWTFRNYETDDKKGTTSTISFVFGILTISTIYFFTPRAEGYGPIGELLHVFGFAIGIAIRSLFISYLLVRFINRLELAKLNWTDAFAIVAFSLIPFIIGYLWALADIRTASIGQLIGAVWNAIIIIAGLKIYKKVPLWKGALLVIGILVMLKIAELMYSGYSISY